MNLKNDQFFVRFLSEKRPIFDVNLYFFYRRAFAIRLREGFLNIGYGY